MDALEVDVMLTRLAEDYRALQGELEAERAKTDALEQELETLREQMEEVDMDDSRSSSSAAALFDQITKAEHDAQVAAREEQEAIQMYNAAKEADYVPPQVVEDLHAASKRAIETANRLAEVRDRKRQKSLLNKAIV